MVVIERAMRTFNAKICVWALAFATTAAVGGAGCGRSGAAVDGSARIHAGLTGAAPIARMTVTISPGDGPGFSPFTADLERSTASLGEWTAYVTGVPAGTGRLFTVSAYAQDGTVSFSGSGKCDIAPGASALVEIQLGEPPSQPLSNGLPVIDYIGASSTIVPPGGVVSLHASGHDPDSTDTVAYRWAALCGTLEGASTRSALWTAPNSAGSCQLSITLSDGRGGSVTAFLDMAIAATRTVSGTRLVTYWPDPPASKVTVPAADVLAGRPPSALTRDAQGGWIEHAGGHLEADGTFVAGSYGLDGSFVIPDTQVGAYAICLGMTGGALACADTAQDSVDVGYDVLGRPDQISPTAPTPVTLIFSGLDPWNPTTDVIELTSSGANLWNQMMPPFRLGETGGEVLQDWHAPAGDPALNLLVPKDTVFVHQLSTRSLYMDGKLLTYIAATEATPAPPDPNAITSLSMVDGQSATISASLERLPLTATVAVDWDMSEFERHRDVMAPPARMSPGATSHELVVKADAFSLKSPAPASPGSPDLLVLRLPAGLSRLTSELYYGRFLPPVWHEWLGVSYEAAVSYLAPGATLPAIDVASVSRRDAIPAPSGTIAPIVSPALSPRLNGEDAFPDRATPVTTTPTLSWSPPTTGVPTAYVVELFKLSAQGASTMRTLVMRYATRNLEITVPPGVLGKGVTYYAKIDAQVTTVPFDAAPLRRANVYASANTLTGTFTP
jgi:hypothetical protein